MSDSSRTEYRWYILALSAATHTFAAAIPFSCLPALFKEISDDLGLSLVQIGTVWGMVSLAGVFTTFLGGWLGDRFGVRPVLAVACVLAGVTGALRGISSDFAGLTATVFAFGMVRSVVPVNIHKAVSIWFRGRNLGMANGVVSMGMGIGLTLGPLISATLLSPLLGGWRNVLFLYGAISILVGILWFIIGGEPYKAGTTSASYSEVPLSNTLSKLIRSKNLWLLGLCLTFRTACILGMTGYLPLYLRGRGWVPSGADSALAGFYAASAVAVIPLSILSDRLGSRKAILFSALLIALLGVGLLAIVNSIMVWAVVIVVGIFMDGFMAVILTMVQETDGVGPRYSGMALGLVMTLSGLGGFVSPPLGNSLANINAGLPFIFWASLSAVSLVSLAFTKETGLRRMKAVKTV